jgi:hypothetical protein
MRLGAIDAFVGFAFTVFGVVVTGTATTCDSRGARLGEMPVALAVIAPANFFV